MIVVLASGSGTNFQSIVERFGNKVSGLVCNVPGAGVLERAREAGIPARLVPHRDFSTRAQHEAAVVTALRELGSPRLIVLAGYMRILTPRFFELKSIHLQASRMINIHPAPLDVYKGSDGYGAAVTSGRADWALSVHEVIPELDAGPLLGERWFSLIPGESAAALHERVRPLEHSLLNEVIVNILNQEPLL